MRLTSYVPPMLFTPGRGEGVILDRYYIHSHASSRLNVCMSRASTLARHRRRSPDDHDNSNKSSVPNAITASFDEQEITPIFIYK